jgi:FSR family fosmidomycin resistance protein-like MFS transporter
MLFAPKPEKTTGAVLPVLIALSFSHFLNDMLQSLVPSIYPIIKDSYGLDYAQIGLITFTFQLAGSIFQPVVGMYTDLRPQPYSTVVGMAFSILGLTVLAFAGSYYLLLLGAALLGTGSSIFHPETTRMVRVASGGRHGFAQSVFQVGGHAGSAAGPLLAAFIVVPLGQASLSWFAVAGLIAAVVLLQIGHWYKRQAPKPVTAKAAEDRAHGRSRLQTAIAVTIVVILMMSKSAYSSSFGSFYTFYLLGKFSVSVQTSQMMLFLFLLAAPLGTLMGGYVGDIFGRRRIIWFSILGALPFTLILPYVDVFWTGVLSVIIGLIMASAFPALIVYAMELLPGRLGLVAGIFYGLAFGLGAMFAALLGQLADFTSINFVFHLCAFVPALGLLTWFLPDVGQRTSKV